MAASDEHRDGTGEHPGLDPRLIALAEGGLDAAEVAALEARLAADPAGRVQLTWLRTTLAELAEPAAAASPGEAVVARLRAAFAAERGAAAAPSPRERAASAARAAGDRAAAWLATADRVVAALVFDGRRPLALPGFRSGGAAGGGLAFASDRGRLDLEVGPAPSPPPAEATADDGDAWRIRGQLRTRGGGAEAPGGTTGGAAAGAGGTHSNAAATGARAADADAATTAGPRVAVLDAGGRVLAETVADARGGFSVDVAGPADAVAVELPGGTALVAPGLGLV